MAVVPILCFSMFQSYYPVIFLKCGFCKKLLLYECNSAHFFHFVIMFGWGQQQSNSKHSVPELHFSDVTFYKIHTLVIEIFFTFQFPEFWSEFWSEKQPILPMKYVPYFSGKLLNRGCPIIIVTDKSPFYDHFIF